MQSNHAPNLELARRLNVVAILLSLIIVVTIGMTRRIHIQTTADFSVLPSIYAALNTVVAVVLILGLVFIKRKQIARHRACMMLAMAISAVFLVLYVLYHMTTEETPYCFEGAMRTIYFIVLISHVVLAAIIFPFVLFTFVRGYTGQFDRHKKMARWVYPVWLYVAISGPVVYLMLRPCYG